MTRYSIGKVKQMEECLEGLHKFQKAVAQMVTELTEDFSASLDIVGTEVAELSTKVNLTIRAMGNKAPTWGVVQFNKVRISEPKSLCGVRDAKVVKNFIFDME